MIKFNEIIQNLMLINNDIELIQVFINQVQNIKNIKNEDIYFKECIDKYFYEFQKLFSQKLNNIQTIQEEITYIMKYAQFNLNLNNNTEPHLKYEDVNILEKHRKYFDYNDIKKLRDNIILTRNLSDEYSKEEKKIFNSIKSFFDRVNEIEKINQLLQKIWQKGYFENINIVIKIIENSASIMNFALNI